MIVDHLFTPPAGEPWARCVICGLSEAAHARTAEPYKPTPTPVPWCGTPALMEAERRRIEGAT